MQGPHERRYQQTNQLPAPRGDPVARGGFAGRLPARRGSLGARRRRVRVPDGADGRQGRSLGPGPPWRALPGARRAVSGQRAPRNPGSMLRPWVPWRAVQLDLHRRCRPRCAAPRPGPLLPHTRCGRSKHRPGAELAAAPANRLSGERLRSRAARSRRIFAARRRARRRVHATNTSPAVWSGKEGEP